MPSFMACSRFSPEKLARGLPARRRGGNPRAGPADRREADGRGLTIVTPTVGFDERGARDPAVGGRPSAHERDRRCRKKMSVAFGGHDAQRIENRGVLHLIAIGVRFGVSLTAFFFCLLRPRLR
jgi:hypothetical protein